MTTPALGSILLASSDPDRLRSWYESAFGAVPDPDGFLHFGDVAVLIDGRTDVQERNPEPVRVILNFHVDDAKAAAARINDAGVTWLVEPEQRKDGWFGTLLDPDGNCIQIIELNPEYFAARA